MHKVEPLSTFEAHDAHEPHDAQKAQEAQDAGRSSTPAYIENEWQLAALAAQDALGVSAQLLLANPRSANTSVQLV